MFTYQYIQLQIFPLTKSSELFTKIYNDWNQYINLHFFDFLFNSFETTVKQQAIIVSSWFSVYLVFLRMKVWVGIYEPRAKLGI